MSINVKIPACILPDIAQFIIYKKLVLRKKKMLYFANKLMTDYNAYPIRNQKMDMKDAITIVYSATKMPCPDFMHPKQSEWYRVIKNKYPQYYSKWIIPELCLSIYKIFIDDDDETAPNAKSVLNGTWFAYNYILEVLYSLTFTKEEKSILSFRKVNKKALAKVTVDSLTFDVIVKLVKEKQDKKKK